MPVQRASHQEKYAKEKAGVGPLGLRGLFEVVLDQLHVAKVGLVTAVRAVHAMQEGAVWVSYAAAGGAKQP
jgi:hypothetical protein